MKFSVNSALERQIKKHLGSIDDLPERVRLFLAVISDSYDNSDEDRVLLERSLSISSREMTEKNQKLQAEVALSAKKAKELEETKAAILNVLEDEKKTVESLRESENRLRQAQSIGRVGSYELDLRTDAVSVSSSLRTILGVEDGRKLTKKVLLGFIVASQRRAVSDIISHHNKANVHFTHEVSILKSNTNEVRWLALSG